MNNDQETVNLQKALAALGAAIGKIISKSIEQAISEKQHIQNPINMREIISTGRILTKNQTAELLNVSTRTVDQWMKRRVMPYLKIGRTVRFKEDDMMRRLNEYTLFGRARINR